MLHSATNSIPLPIPKPWLDPKWSVEVGVDFWDEIRLMGSDDEVEIEYGPADVMGGGSECICYST